MAYLRLLRQIEELFRADALELKIALFQRLANFRLLPDMGPVQDRQRAIIHSTWTRESRTGVNQNAVPT